MDLNLDKHKNDAKYAYAICPLPKNKHMILLGYIVVNQCHCALKRNREEKYLKRLYRIAVKILLPHTPLDYISINEEKIVSFISIVFMLS